MNNTPPGILDNNCQLARDLCAESVDSLGVPCVHLENPMTGMLCLTRTQERFFTWLEELLDDLGIKSEITLTDGAGDSSETFEEQVNELDKKEGEAVEGEEDSEEDKKEVIKKTEEDVEKSSGESEEEDDEDDDEDDAEDDADDVDDDSDEDDDEERRWLKGNKQTEY